MHVVPLQSPALASRAASAKDCAPRTSRTSHRAARVVAQAASGGNGAAKEKAPSPAINVIPKSRWPTGVPPAMGGHYMPSGEAAPLSQSKGPGIDIAPLYFTYPAGELDVAVNVYGTDSAAADGLADLVAAASAEAIAAKGSFAISLSGGSLVNSLAALVGRKGVDFSKWWVFWVDERNVPHASPDSNYGSAKAAFLSKVPIPAHQVIAIKEGLQVAQAAAHYEGRLLDLTDVLPRNAEGFPVFDSVLLGVGPDGHVASLFPNTKETAATSGWVLPVANSPKPPPERITLTVPVLNAARSVAIVALGQGKADVVQRALEVQSLPGALPAQLVRPAGGKLTWVLDTAAAAQLSPSEWAAGKKFPRSERPASPAAKAPAAAAAGGNGASAAPGGNPGSADPPAAEGSGEAQAKQPSPAINVIPKSRWATGVPPAMGGHYMPSGEAAPLSQSKGPGIDIAPLYFTYPAGELDVAVNVYGSSKEAAAGLADLVAAASAEAIAAKGSFAIALSGGSLVDSLAALVGRKGVDFSKWWVFWVDERNVPHASPDSNYGAAKAAFLAKVPIPAHQVIAIKEGLPVAQAASHYEGRLLDLTDVLPRNAEGFAVIDCVLLGVGPDGHVASLFPNTKETAATSGWVLPVANSPKPPPERITLTMPVLNAARSVAIVALGQGKADVVQRALEVQSLPGALPAQLVRPAGGKLTWVLDTAAAAQLSPSEWAAGKKFPRSERPQQ